ncbi:MAG: DUF1292 domain-containing protein, partial [Eubacteriales bacterium]
KVKMKMAEEKNPNEELEEEFEEEEIEVYTLVDDETGEEKQFECIGKTEMDGNTYYALIPFEEESDEYVILKLVVSEDGDDSLETIEDDAEFDKIADYFDNTLFDEIDYDAE